MITRAKIKQLEGKYIKAYMSKCPITWHESSSDGRLLDEDGYVMTDREVKVVELADREVHARGGAIWYLIEPCDPRVKPHSTVTPHFKK